MKKYLSEFIGTFSMIFCGCGAMVINDFTGGTITHPGVAITWGLIVMSMIYAFGDISGAHFNPAVTLGFAVANKFKWIEVPKYIIAQLLGALTASCILLFLFPESDLGATIPIIEPLKVFIIELLLSFFFNACNHKCIYRKQRDWSCGRYSNRKCCFTRSDVCWTFDKSLYESYSFPGPCPSFWKLYGSMGLPYSTFCRNAVSGI